MPPVVVAVAAAAVAYGATAAAVSAGIVIAGSFAATLVGAIAGLAVSFIGSSLLSSKPRAPPGSTTGGTNLTTTSVTQSVKQPIATHKIIYGQMMIGGALTFVDTSPGNQVLHLIFTLACHPVAEIGEVYLAGVRVPLDSNGNALAPPRNPDGTTPTSYVGLVQCFKSRGTVADDTQFSARVQGGTSKWGTTCRQSGRAKVYLRMTWDQNIFGSIGIPNFSAIVKGRMIFDARETAIAIDHTTTGSPGLFSTGGTSHGLIPGDLVWFKNYVSSTPAVDQAYEVATTPDGTTFSVYGIDSTPLAVSVAGTGGTITKMKWTDNAALCCNDYLCDSVYGFDAKYSEEVDETILNSSANVCDEMVDLASFYTSTVIASPPDDGLQIPTSHILQTGLPFLLSSTGTLPAPLQSNTLYFAISQSDLDIQAAVSLANAILSAPVNITDTGSGTHTLTQVEPFAATDENGNASTIGYNNTNLISDTSLANSLRLMDNKGRIVTGTKVIVSSLAGISFPSGITDGGTYYAILVTDDTIRIANSIQTARSNDFIAIGSVGGGAVTVPQEPRYCCNGVVDTANARQDIITGLLTSMGGYLVPSGVTLSLYPAAYRTPNVTLDENDLDGPIGVQTLTSADSSFNSVKGVFVDPFSNWQAADLPVIQNSSYIADDNGEVVWSDAQFTFTTSTSMAQRLMNIELERIRRELTLSMKCKFTAFQVGVPDVIEVNNTMWGFSAETFEVQNWSLNIRQDKSGEPYPGIDIIAAQTDSSVYSWDTSKQLPQRSWINSTLPNPFSVSPPTGMALSSGTADLYTRLDGTIFSRILVSWSQSSDSFVINGGFVECQYRQLGISPTPEWQKGPTVPGDQISLYILDVHDGQQYDVRIRFQNSSGVYSDTGTTWSSTITDYTVVGKSEPPSDPPSLFIQQNGALIILTAGSISDRDVGAAEFRYGTSAEWDTMALIEPSTARPDVNASITTANVPPGTWYFGVKYIDTSKNYSASAAYRQATISTSGLSTIESEPQSPDWVNLSADINTSLNATVDALSTGPSAAVSVTSHDHNNMTVSPGLSNSALIAVYSFDFDTLSSLIVKWGTQTMTEITDSIAFGNRGCRIFGLINPDPGNKTLSASWDIHSDVIVAAMSAYNIDQTGGATTFYGATDADDGGGGSATASVSVSSALNDLCVMVATSSIDFTSGTNSNTPFPGYPTGSGYNETGAAQYAPGATTVAFSWSLDSSANWSAAAIGIKAASGGSSGGGFVLNVPAGKIIPDGIYPWSHYSTWAALTSFCPDPIATATYEAPQIDLGFNDSPRFYAAQFVVGALAGVAGTPSVKMQVDYWADGDTDPNLWHDWTAGTLPNVRYIRSRLVETPGSVPAWISDWTPTADKGLVTEQIPVQTIAAGGTTVTFNQPFHSAPLVTCIPQSGANIGWVTDVNSTSAKLHVGSDTATDSGGSAGGTAVGI